MLQAHPPPRYHDLQRHQTGCPRSQYIQPVLTAILQRFQFVQKKDLTDNQLSTDRRAGGRATPISQPRWIFFKKDKDGVQTTTLVLTLFKSLVSSNAFEFFFPLLEQSRLPA
ncbi:hypothetical protein B0T13DRAFT_465857 [Neurospora crassa]|nr:hypothetical protein B0T13DRAFT_465857 [Neurospora crassa]